MRGKKMDSIDSIVVDSVGKWTPENQNSLGDAIEYVDRYVDGDFFDIYNMSIEQTVEELNTLYKEVEEGVESKNNNEDVNPIDDVDEDVDVDMSLLKTISDIAFALHWHNLNLRLEDKFHFQVVNETNW